MPTAARLPGGNQPPPRAPIALALVALLALSGCGIGPADAPGGPCAPGQTDQPEFCVRAVALAEAQLGWLHPPITAAFFRSSLCPPNARCVVTLVNEGWVIFELMTGDPVMVYVGPPDPVDDQSLELVARPGEPPPEWLLEELEPS